MLTVALLQCLKKLSVAWHHLVQVALNIFRPFVKKQLVVHVLNHLLLINTEQKIVSSLGDRMK